MAVIGNFQFADRIINHTELNGVSILTNGLEPMQKYDPVTGEILPLVLRPFRQNVALAAGGAGNLNGTYVYRVVPYNENQDEEGEAFPLSDDVAAFEITVANQSVNVNLAALVADNAEVTHVRIYRTLGDGSWPVLARVATVALPAGVYNDNTDDDDLDVANEGLNTFIQVPAPKPYITTHNSRAFGWGDVPYADGQANVTNGSDRVTASGAAVFGFWLEDKEFHAEDDGRAYIIDAWDPDTNELVLREAYAGVTRTTDYRICGDADKLIWTEPDFENQWAAINNRNINKKEDDKPTGIFPQGRRLILPKSKRTYALYYNNNPALSYSTTSIISSAYGCVSHRTMKDVEGVVHWLSKDGVVSTRPESSVVLVSRELGEFVNEDVRLDATGEQQFCFGVALKSRGEYLCFYPDQDSILGCNKAFVYHYLERKWSIFEFGTEFTTGSLIVNSEGNEVAVLGDRYGYLWEYPYGNIDGAPPNGTISGTVDAYTREASPGCAITDNDASFVTSGLGLAGIPIYIHTGTGAGQWAIIAFNTDTTIYLEDCFAIDLDETSQYYIGPIEARYKSGWNDFGTLDRSKWIRYLSLAFEKNDSDLRLQCYGDFSDTPESLEDRNPRVTTPTDYAVVDMNNDDEDSDNIRGHQRVPLGGIRKTHFAWELYDDKPANPWSIYDVSIDLNFKEQ